MVQSIYESPFLLAAVGVVATIVLLSLWRRKNQLVFLAFAMFAAAIIPAAFYLDAAVETDREQVETALAKLIVDYRDRKTQAVADAISQKNFTLQAAAVALINVYNFENERVTDISVSESEAGYDSHFRLNADFLSANHGSFGRRPTRWNVHWVEENSQWKVRDVTRLDPVNGRELSGWEKLKP